MTKSPYRDFSEVHIGSPKAALRRQKAAKATPKQKPQPKAVARRQVPAAITALNPGETKPTTAHPKQHILSFAAGATLGVASVAAGAYAGLASLGIAAAATAAFGKVPQPASCALGLVSGCVAAFTLAVVNLAPHHPHRTTHAHHASHLIAEQQVVLGPSTGANAPKFTMRIAP